MSSVATTTGNAASENTLFSVNEKVKQHINKWRSAVHVAVIE